MPVQPNLLERTAFYTLNQAPGVMLDMAGGLSYQALSTALQLGVFKTLAERPLTVTELAGSLEAQERGVEALLQALAATGYVEASNGHFANSAMTRKWLVGSEAMNGEAIMSFWDDIFTDLWPLAAEVIRTGERPFDTYDWIESDPDRNRSFQETLVVTALSTGPDIAKRLDLPGSATRLLDVGGGHGLFSITMLQRYPNLKATLIDRPAALEIAAEYVVEYGMEDRIELVAGNMWDLDWGTGYDTVLLFNMIHHFDLDTNTELLRKSAAALKSGGTVAILDQISGSIRGAATNALIRLVGLMFFVMADGRVFSREEVEGILTQAGFNETRTQGIPRLPGNSLMTAKRT